MLALAPAATNTLVSLVIFGYLLAGWPLSRLGSNAGGGRCTKCLGFDVLRGQFGWVASSCICAPTLLVLLSASPAVKWAALLAAALIFASWLFGTHTSHPGGPREHRILREPQWPDKTWYVDAGWRCAVAEESHDRTHDELPNGHKLTGEPAGRQTWHREPGGMFSAAEGARRRGGAPSEPRRARAVWRRWGVPAPPEAPPPR